MVPITQKPVRRFARSRQVLLTRGICLFFGLMGISRLLAQPDTSQLRAELALTAQLLAGTDAQHQALSDLRILNRRLDIQSQLVQLLTADITQYQSELEALQENICLLEEGQEKLRQEYQATVRETYRNYHPQSFWLVLLSSGSLTEAYYRSQYFREYSRYRKEQLLLMQESQTMLGEQLAYFERIWNRSSRLARARRTELARQRATSRLQKKLYLNLRKKAQGLRQEYHQQQQAIQRMIREAALPAGEPAPPPSAEALSESFSTAKGQLTWPAPPDQSVIVETFGISKDDYGNIVENEGITLRVSQGQRIKAAFDGRVTGVRAVPLLGTAVILEHGIYRTVYANLAATTLQEGEWVPNGTLVGIARSDIRTGETLVKFMIYQSPATFLDPLSWLAH